MIATSLRSMPRLITINPMPSPRIPRIEMLRARLSRFPTLAKPDSVRLNTMRRTTVMSRTICSCDGFVGSQRTQGIGARGAELISLDMVATGNRGGMRQLQGGRTSRVFCSRPLLPPGGMPQSTRFVDLGQTVRRCRAGTWALAWFCYK